MNGLVFRMPLACLIGMGLVACSAAGESPTPRGGGTPTGDADVWEPGPLQLGNPLQSPTTPRVPDDAGGAGDDEDDETNSVDDPRCECDELPPGVTVDLNDGGITVVVELPTLGAITITTPSGSCSTSESGISIEGDVTIDVGSGAPIALVDAVLDLSVGQGMPILTGAANIPGGILDSIGCGCSDSWLPVDVSLTHDADLGVGADIALELALPTDEAVIDTSALPFGGGIVGIADADLTLLTNGEHERLEIAGTIAASADLWSSELPLTADAELDVLATLDDRALISVQVMGDLELEGDELRSGITPLRSLELPSAWLTLDQQGAQVHATASASAHPAFSVEARALVDARFTPSTWSILVCADVMTDLISASVRIGQCVDSTPEGPVICECRRDDHGHCEGDDRPSEH